MHSLNYGPCQGEWDINEQIFDEQNASRHVYLFEGESESSFGRRCGSETGGWEALGVNKTGSAGTGVHLTDG